MKKYLCGLILLSVLLLSGCNIPTPVEGTVSDVYIGFLTPKVSHGPYTFIRFIDGRTFVFGGTSPEPIEKDRYQRIYYDYNNNIVKVEPATPQRPSIPGELR